MGGSVLADVGVMLVVGLALSILIGISLGLLGGGGSILTGPVIHSVLGVAMITP